LSSIEPLGGTPPKRFVVTVFDSAAKAKEWDASAATKKVTAMRQKSTTRAHLSWMVRSTDPRGRYAAWRAVRLGRYPRCGRNPCAPLPMRRRRARRGATDHTGGLRVGTASGSPDTCRTRRTPLENARLPRLCRRSPERAAEFSLIDSASTRSGSRTDRSPACPRCALPRILRRLRQEIPRRAVT
jgi:hypothetical protein